MSQTKAPYRYDIVGSFLRTQAIKNATEELTKAFYAVSEKLYGQQGGQAGQPGPDMGGANFGGQAQQGGASAGPDVVDADYEVVDDDNNKK